MSEIKKSLLGIEEYAKQKDGVTLCGELKHTVIVAHGDGSMLLLKHAMVELRDEWFIVFAEHFKPLVFHIEDAKYQVIPSIY